MPVNVMSGYLYVMFSPDVVVDPWLRSLLEKLLSLHPLPPGLEPIRDTVLYPHPSLPSVLLAIAVLSNQYLYVSVSR